ncbi:MAG TPA: alpha/beta fold hydrolase [Brevundimonas sp.]|uniref:alpha/beta fold hydrolase n=1 Tax=Brevundimonas sp. TaxID=1871086 RepID=UPI00261B5472|nr:alpha/beta fold hydrolase [Brevundimonas sp.]HRO34080.1 alpha/beta fold hydrolase [Brevundimonas sp.]
MKRAVILMALMLSACATPMVQAPLTPPAGFAGARIEDQAFVVRDGGRLPYLRWSPDGAPRAVVVALHGMNDSAASFRLAGPWWAEQGIETWAYDQRGFGRAPGRGVWAGQGAMTDDLRDVVALVRAARPGVPVIVAGESMGGSVAIAAFASDRPPDADRVLLLAPGVWGWSSQGPINGAALWVAARAMGDRPVGTPQFVARRVMASDNLIELIRNGRDPSSIMETRFDAVSGLVDLMETASLDLGAMRRPALLMYGAADHVIARRPMRMALERAGAAPALRTAWYPNGRHLLNRDLEAQTVYRDALAYFLAPDAALPSAAPGVLDQLRR